MDCTCNNLLSGLGVLGQRRGMVSNTKFSGKFEVHFGIFEFVLDDDLG